MSKKIYIKRQLLILEKLQDGFFDFKEIQDYIRRRFEDDDIDYEILKRTFERDVVEIRDIYGIDIKYDRKEKYYYVKDEDSVNKMIRLLESYQMFTILSLSNQVTKFMFLEKRKPLGIEIMRDLLRAIRKRVEISCIYEKFWEASNAKDRRSLLPLALKEARNRWYLIAQDTKDDEIKSFGLDRITNLEISKTTFTYPEDLHVEKDFEHAFGIINSEEAPEKIKLWFNREQGNYIKSLPLHHSQKLLTETPTEMTFELFICPTHDFMMELLSMGANVKVLEPESLKQKIKKKLLDAVGLYE